MKFKIELKQLSCTLKQSKQGCLNNINFAYNELPHCCFKQKTNILKCSWYNCLLKNKQKHAFLQRCSCNKMYVPDSWACIEKENDLLDNTNTHTWLEKCFSIVMHCPAFCASFNLKHHRKLEARCFLKQSKQYMEFSFLILLCGTLGIIPLSVLNHHHLNSLLTKSTYRIVPCIRHPCV